MQIKSRYSIIHMLQKKNEIELPKQSILDNCMIKSQKKIGIEGANNCVLY